MRLLVAGASGLIGAALARSLTSDGHEVRRLVRRAAATASEVSWRPDQGEIDDIGLDGVDAVVCLSGAGVGEHRWTAAYKQTIRESRLATVGTLASALARVASPPATFLAASAVGYYGDTGSEQIDERRANGRGFLAEVCRDWEAAAQPAKDAGVRVANLRTGLVLARGAGMLARMTPLVKLGVAGRLGNGSQYWPWISLEDEVAAIRFVLDADTIVGPVNLTGPNPVTNREFTETMARLMHRPAKLPVPGFALRLALGGFASDVLGSQRAVPAKLTAAGFHFAHPDLETALRYALAG